MPVFSKPICNTGTCWDLVHPWEPSCVRASIESLIHGITFSIKLYALFYTVSAIVQRRKPSSFVKDIVPGIIRSSVFLTVNSGLLISLMCASRKLLGGFYYWSVVAGPAMICSLMAILIERRERRTPLAVYIMTQLTESLFNMMKSKNWIKPVPYGEIAIFAIASALSMREYTINGKRTGLIGSFLRLLFTPKFPHFVTKHLPKEGTGGWMSRVAQITAWSFLVGYVLKVLSGVVGLISKGPKSWFEPEEIRQRLFGKWNFRLALFCACFSGGYKVVSKALEAVGVTGSMNATVAGAVAGLSMLFYPSSTLALYAFFKSFQSLGSEWSQKGYVKFPPHMDSAVYTLATALLLHIGIFEPVYCKHGYFLFLLRLFGRRTLDYNFAELHMWNREVVDFVDSYKRANS